VARDGKGIRLTLASTGTYTILVHVVNYDDTGSYYLSIQSVTGGGCNGRQIVCGQSVSADIISYTEADAYSYTAVAGEMLSIGFGSSTGYGNPMTADIYNPSGQMVTNVAVANGGKGIRLTLASAGTYTILVHVVNYDDTGSYSLGIQSVIGGGCNGTPVVCGQTVSTNTSFNTEMDAYGFGTDGGTVFLSFSGAGYSGAQFDLYDPMGNKVFTGTPGTAMNTNLVAGSYTLLVHDANYSGTGSYGFTVTCPFPICNYSINPTSISVGPGAANGTVHVTAESGCGWTATNNASWLTITSGSSGTNSGMVSYTVDANCSPIQRSGTMTIAGFEFHVNQASPVVLLGGIDIGAPGAPGSWSYTNCGAYTLSGSGEGTDGSADVFYLAYTNLAGDGQIMARLQSLQGGDPHLAEAGIMIRQSLDPASEQVSLSVNASTNVIFSRRLATPGKSIPNSFQGTNYLHGTNYIWLRLMRMGNTFVAHYSTNGLDWQYMWFTTVNMSSQVQVGLAVTAHYNGELATAVFDNVSIGSLTPLSGTWPLPEPVSLLGGQDWSPAEFQRVGGFEFLLAGVVGDYYSIKGSTSITTPLASWSQVATVTNTYGVVPFIDPQALTTPVRFYRAQRIGP